MKILFLLALASPSFAYVAKFQTQKSSTLIQQQLEAATGLLFHASCTPAQGGCSVNGSITTADAAVLVEVYEEATSDPRVVPVVVTQALQKQIADAIAQ